MLTIILLIIGLFAGVLSGLLGIGGGTIFTPVLFYLFDRHGIANPELWTIGTSLFCTFAASSGGTLRHIQQHSAFIRESLLVGVFGIIGTTLGKLLATSEWFTRDEFLVLIAVVFLYTGANFIRKSWIRAAAPAGTTHQDKVIGTPEAGAIGGAGGFVAALSGLGGGVLMVPIMNIGLRYSLRKSVSVSEFAIVMISLSGFLQYAMRNPARDLPGSTAMGVTVADDIASGGLSDQLDGSVLDTGGEALLSIASDPITTWTIGYLDLGVCLPLVIGAFLGAGYGVHLHDRIETRYIKRIFGVLLLIVAARMAAELF